MDATYVLTLLKDIEIKEFEWYLRDHFFRQSSNNQRSRQKFQKDTLGKEMMNLYLRYRNSNLEKINELINIVTENLLSRRVIIKGSSNTAAEDNNDSSFELTSKLSRLQCSRCFYISYLADNERKNCLRCSSTELHDFPRRK